MMYHQNWLENQRRNRNDPTINIIIKKEFRMSSETFITAGMTNQDTVTIALKRLLEILFMLLYQRLLVYLPLL